MSARATFSDQIRAAAGRTAPAHALEPDQPVGNIGIGRGGAAGPMRATTTNDEINAAIRRGARLARDVLVPGGIRLDDVDLLDRGR